MMLTTDRLTSLPRHPLILTHRASRRQFHPDLIGLTCLAVAAALAGAFGPAVALGALLGAGTGQADVTQSVASLGWTFLPISAAVAAIWLLGAIQTRRVIHRLGGLNEGDRIAIAELHRLLARE